MNSTARSPSKSVAATDAPRLSEGRPSASVKRAITLPVPPEKSTRLPASTPAVVSSKEAPTNRSLEPSPSKSASPDISTPS